MSVTILSPRQWTRADKIGSAEAASRPVGVLPGSHLSDICSIRQTVMLCPLCQGKFRPRKNWYRPWRVKAMAKCDACRTLDPNVSVFIAEETYNRVIYERSRKGRWAL